MNQEKIAKLIKEIRLKNNLTQKEFAEKLGVTYQAVSKWENAKNIPDIGVLKEIKKIYNIDIDDLLDGETSKRKVNKIYFVIVFLIVLIVVLLFLLFNKKEDFTFKQISTKCDDFNISGTVAYNKNKTAIHISNIEYCGDVNDTLYDNIECSLYESYKDTETKIKSCESKSNIKLEDYLKKIDIELEHTSTTCRMFKGSSMYLLINATNKKNITTTYKIPIELEEDCEK